MKYLLSTTALALTLAGAAMTSPASAVILNVGDIGATETSTVVGTVEPFGPISGLTADITLTYTGATGVNNTTWNFLYSVDNTTSGSLTSEVSAFGLFTTPNVVSATSTGLYSTVGVQTQAGFLGVADFCASAGGTCGGGGSSGIDPNDPAASGMFSLTFASLVPLTSISLDNIFARFQGITGTVGPLTFEGDSGFGTPPGGPTPFNVNPVPGPIVGAGIPGLVAACLTMLGIRRYRQRRFFGTV
jgi:hypothetical protein